MEIYDPKPEKLVRLQICKKGEKTEYLTLCKTTKEDVKKFISDILKEEKTPIVLNDDKKTSVNIREAIGAKNLKSISISFRGLSAKETLNLILKKMPF